MKMFALIATGLLGLAATAPVAAIAAPVAPVQERVVVRERTTTIRHDDGRWHGGPRWGSRRVCTNRWRNHRKARVCRTVRYRR